MIVAIIIILFRIMSKNEFKMLRKSRNMQEFAVTECLKRQAVIYIVLALYITTVDFKSNSQDEKQEMLTFSFSSKRLTKVLH